MHKIANLVSVCIQADIPCLIWGPPGVGKSALTTQIASLLGLPIEVVIASLREPTDIAGLPVIKGDEVVFMPPRFAKRASEKGTLIFWDELTCAPPANQAALMRVFLDREAGDLRFHADTRQVAAANPADVATDGSELAPAFANRQLHLDYELSAAEWVTGRRSGWPAVSLPRLPSDWWQKCEQTAVYYVTSFISRKPDALFAFPKEESERGRAWPSPRSWDMAIRALAACKSLGYAPTDEISMDLVVGCVGKSTGLEFIQFITAEDLGDPNEALANPETYVLPQRTDRLLSFMLAVSAAALTEHETRPARYHAAWQIIARVAKDQQDCAFAAAKALAGHLPPGCRLPSEIHAITPILNVFNKAGK